MNELMKTEMLCKNIDINKNGWLIAMKQKWGQSTLDISVGDVIRSQNIWPVWSSGDHPPRTGQKNETPE